MQLDLVNADQKNVVYMLARLDLVGYIVFGNNFFLIWDLLMENLPSRYSECVDGRCHTAS